MFLVTLARNGYVKVKRKTTRVAVSWREGGGVKEKNTIGMDLKDHSAPLWSIPL